MQKPLPWQRLLHTVGNARHQTGLFVLFGIPAHHKQPENGRFSGKLYHFEEMCYNRHVILHSERRSLL